MINDPGDELVRLATAVDEDPTTAQRRAAALVRRRFGLSLPPPFADRARSGSDAPVRVAGAHDGAAMAAVKWRAWRLAYRGMVPDRFLDRLPVYPPPGFWATRAAVPPSRRHCLLVAGRRGEVHGLCDAGPVRAEDLDPDTTAEVTTLYVDPSAQGLGIGGALLAAAVDRLVEAGLDDVRLWVLRDNADARRFYEERGWVADGATQTVPVHGESFSLEEVRYRLR